MTDESYDPAILLAACPVPLLVVDGQNHVLFASAAAYMLWPTEVLIGRHIDALLVSRRIAREGNFRAYIARQAARQRFDVRSASIGDADHRLLALHDVSVYAARLARLNRLALTDPLTRLANRRGFHRALRHEHRRMMRENQPLSLLAIDLDGLKARNDTYGHAAGDLWLQNVAATLINAAQRPGDVAARVGGDEFALLLPETDLDGAGKVATRIHQLLGARAPTGDAGPTVGIGIATMGQHPGCDSPAALLHAADADLYRSRTRPLRRSGG
ncbi:GGDEF domain-containing protein [Sphingomonas sp. PB2P19]|uniref:GGDEF domain-containing protein n=1 Tax=Sphingomonas rhamnosi TaxID=3096156 RepID=UPI002FC6A1C8